MSMKAKELARVADLLPKEYVDALLLMARHFLETWNELRKRAA